MIMNYKKLIIDGHTGRQTTPLVSYFKQQAQIAKRDNYVEFIDFFNACKTVVAGYRHEIEAQYRKRLTENDWVLKVYYAALDRGETNTQNGEPIQNHIDYIENDKKFVENRGYANNDFVCRTTEAGDIVEDVCVIKCRLYYSDIADLEQAITQAEQELTNANTNKSNRRKPQRTIDAEKLNPYFKSTFKGMGNNNLNYFNWLIDHLKTERTPKAFAQIALMIYESKTALNNTKPNTFKGWYSVFCECVGCEQKTYQPKDLRTPSDTIKSTFNYL
jgi:hypothetical protein